MGVATAKHGNPTWGAQRHLTVGCRKVRSLSYERIEAGGAAGFPPVYLLTGGEKTVRVFVGLQQQYIGTSVHSETFLGKWIY